MLSHVNIPLGLSPGELERLGSTGGWRGGMVGMVGVDGTDNR